MYFLTPVLPQNPIEYSRMSGKGKHDARHGVVSSCMAIVSWAHHTNAEPGSQEVQECESMGDGGNAG